MHKHAHMYVYAYIQTYTLPAHIMNSLPPCRKGVKRPLHFNCIHRKFAFGNNLVVCMKVLKIYTYTYIQVHTHTLL